MSDTPRTDAAEYPVWSEANQGMGEEYAEQVVDAEFARDLERELAAALAEIERLKAKNVRPSDFRPKGFNHGIYEVDYRGEEKPTAQEVIAAATKFAGTDKLYFTIGQREIDHRWKNWRRHGRCEFSLCVMRHDGRSYLHG